MNLKLVLQLHVHSDKSHDSYVSIKDYVNYLEKILSENECAVLGITDHNVVPIKTKEALSLSTKKVIVIPGIQWKIYKNLGHALKKLCTRREILTLGDHDDLKEYINKKTHYSILKNDEILGNFKEEEFLNYLSNNKEIILIMPHPRHFGVDYYGKNSIKKLKQEIDEKKIYIPFFVEEKNGYDPFPRILFSYKNKYLTLGGSDAHEIKSFLETNSLFSVETHLDCNNRILNSWQKAINNKNVALYKKTIKNIFNVLKKKNDEIIIKKRYFRSSVHYLGFFPRFLKRRFDNFPNNVFK